MGYKQGKYRTGRHVVFSLQAHVVLVTKFMRGAISDRVRDVIFTAANEVAKRHEFQIIDIDGEDDHIHLVVDYPPKLSLSKLVMVLKANTAKKVKEQRFEEVEPVFLDDHFWSPSYLVASTGGNSLEKVRRYIQDQRKPPRGPGRPVDET